MTDKNGAAPTVEVRTDANAEHLSALRAVAADLALHSDYDLDAVSDLRLAVDEACSTLVGLAADAAILRCAFSVEADGIRVRAEVSARDGATVDRRGFSWQVLSTLTDTVHADVDDGKLAFIELVKYRRPEAAR